MWTRKRTNIAGKTRDDDWTVLRDGEVVGRVYADQWPREESLRWQWSTLTYPSESGYAATMGEALEEVRRAAAGKTVP